MSFHEILKFGCKMGDTEITNNLVLIGLIFTILQLIISLKIPAPYGRYNSIGPKFLTFCPINAKLAWIIQELPGFLIPTLFLYESWTNLNSSTKILLICFILHYFNRSFIFPIVMKFSSKSPLSTTLLAVLFVCFNGFLQSHTLIHDEKNGTNITDISNTITFQLGILLFGIGSFINIDSDRRLRNLRQNSEKGYKIPSGGIFEYVSAANYFGEILEWWGFALAAKLNPASLFFAGFTTVFLGMRGIQHHNFYLEKFKEDYPKGRRAVIPYLV